MSIIINIGVIYCLFLDNGKLANLAVAVGNADLKIKNMTSLYKDAAMETLITRTIRAAMAQDGMSYAGLTTALADKGIIQSESTLRSKVNNGTMAASLFLHIMSCTSVGSLDFAVCMTQYQVIKNRQP